MSASKYDQKTQEAITLAHLLRGTGVLTGSPLEDGAEIDVAPVHPSAVGRAVALADAYLDLAGARERESLLALRLDRESLNTFIGGAFGQALLVLTQDETQAALRDAFGPLPTEEPA